MMKFVACAGLLVAACLAVANADKLSERPGYQNNMIERLGHFNQQPFIDLYKTYAAAFVKPKNPDRDNNDYRNYMPSGDECMLFFKKFRIDQYKVRDFDQFIVLDACLGYMYANENQEIDVETSEMVKDMLHQLKSDEKLEDLFQGTRIGKLNEVGKTCVANLLLNAVIAKRQFSNVVCNNHWLQVFIQFAECQTVITEDDRADDTYLETLYQLLRERVGICVDHEVGHIERAVRLAFKSQKTNRFMNKMKKPFSTIARQENANMWPHQVTTVLAAVQNTTDQVNQREVHQLIRGVITGDNKLKGILLDNLAYFADRRIKPKDGTKANNADPEGLKRYGNLIDSICEFFRSSDSEADYDFATPLIRMVQLLAHEHLFGISQREFISKVLVHGKETAPIYLSVQACNILTYTEGALAMPTANSKQHYKVVFMHDTSGMILWPDAGYY